jgi:hypothetical protein
MKTGLSMLIGVLLTAQALAEPGPRIAGMMQTPASAFDLFLFRLYEAGKCNNVVKNNNLDEADLCLSSIAYDAEANVLTGFFRVLPGAEAMDDFVDLEADGRREILLRLLDNTARRLGAVDSWGLLHNTPISHGGRVGDADEKAFRAEIAARTTTKLTTSYDGVVYVATRHHDGRIEYFTSK